MSSFARLAPALQAAIVARLGWTSLRPVQDLATAALLDGDNAVVLAPTAGGKTEAAMFPVISQLLDRPPRGLAALYIAPIKALLNNQADRLGQYTEMVGLRRMVWHGDVTAPERKRFLAEPAALLMTTPESLEVMLISAGVPSAALFADLRVVVIDEVHALAGTDRGAHLMSVLERIARLSRHDVQRVGLSATVGNPEQILGWLRGSSHRAGRVIDPPKSPAPRSLLVVHRADLGALANDAAALARGKKSLLFCQSRAVTEATAEQLRRRGTAVFVHHSAVSKEERALAEHRFHHGTDACIVATSTLELGIDVGDLDLVLQIEAPDTVSSFLQRMGRTGRRPGQVANTTFLCTEEDSVLQALSLAVLAKAGWVEAVRLNDRCWPVLVHQLLAMALAADGVPTEEARAHLAALPDTAGVRPDELQRLIVHLIQTGGLLELDGRLVLGPTAERRFGRRNFMELYAVFSSPQSYSVISAAGAPLGSLSQDFTDRLSEGHSSFLLGGRAWAVQQVNHSERKIIVVPAPRGKQPTWGGHLPQFLGFEVCQQTLALLCSEAPAPILHPTAAAVLEARRERFAGLLRPVRGGLERGDDGELRWWTFAGGRVNATLRCGLHAVGGDWRIIPDNYGLRISGEALHPDDLRRALDKFQAPDFFSDPARWEAIAATLPAYRLSKFQSLMPSWAAQEVIAHHLLDRPATAAWVAEAGW